ncbi:hypothetical protein AB0O28_19680 [Microbispora sp. NPDC088329]|uniref:hypothetical protein n=1 Tax=Microbispora sp. NPDC088329 TaxID=3154869 RepID=UPI003438D351
MNSEGEGNRGVPGLILITVIWLVGTPILVCLAFVLLMGRSVWDSTPSNPSLALPLFIAIAALGLGMPLIGSLVAFACGRRIVAGLFAAALITLLIAAGSAGLLPVGQIFSFHMSHEPEVCTAPPEASQGVPGC